MRPYFRAACQSVELFWKAARWSLAGAGAATVLAGGVWFVLQAFKVSAALPYQLLAIICGFAWALFLVIVALLLGAFEGILKQFPSLEKALGVVKQSIVAWLRIPASIALVALYLAILMGRFDALRKPEAFLAIAGIVVVFGLASFLGVCAVNLTWLRRIVFLSLFIAVLLLLVAPQFPHLTAWLLGLVRTAKGPIEESVQPKPVTVNPDSPPAFFDSVTGDPLFWYSQRPPGGFALWDRPGFDRDTRERLQSVASKEKRDEILKWFRSEALRNPKPTNAPPASATNRPITPRAASAPNVIQPAQQVVPSPANHPSPQPQQSVESSHAEALRRARNMMDRSDFKEAIKQSEEALRIKPGDPATTELRKEAEIRLHLREVRTNLQGGSYAKALEAAEAALKSGAHQDEATAVRSMPTQPSIAEPVNRKE